MASRSDSSAGPAGRLAFRILVVLLALFAARAFFFGGPDAERDATPAVAPDGGPREAAITGMGPEPEAAGGSPGSLDADQVCPRSGYLCSERVPGTPLRVTRWPDETGTLRIGVPPPPGEAPARARELRQAAARGLRAWDGHPFRIRVDLSAEAADAHIVTRWSPSLEDGRLGTARTRWARSHSPPASGGGGGRPAEVVVEVLDFALVTRVPSDPSRPLPLRQVELAAAHELGHVLGLPHSDSERDLMFPRNTANRPTARDYRTLEALYTLANGAVIR